MEKIEKLIGKRVMEARIEAKLSQSELASNAKTSLTTINRLERGHQFPNRNTRADIAAALNMSEAELFLDLSEAELRPKTRQELIGDIILALASFNESQLTDVASFISNHKLFATDAAPSNDSARRRINKPSNG